MFPLRWFHGARGRHPFSRGELVTWERLLWFSQWWLSNVLPRSPSDSTAFAMSNTWQATTQRQVRQHSALISPLPVRQQVCIGEKQVGFHAPRLVLSVSGGSTFGSNVHFFASYERGFRCLGLLLLALRRDKRCWTSKCLSITSCPHGLLANIVEGYVCLFALLHEHSSCWSCRVSPRQGSLLVHRYEYGWTVQANLRLARATTSPLA